GFSADYFNTLGSKEAPQTFVSSRSDRTKKKVARPWMRRTLMSFERIRSRLHPGEDGSPRWYTGRT
ncbi:uncharacterized protein STEHIDRAFT_53397, partial [Stereum hirsutum FP-91666 SS1]|uniref:uncharacterized protein n=1 Tax=Stereum hirsutum (strain FP-91666) TaxID=721885 RepID=UPI000440B93E